jgi:hypothetical protein
MRYKAISIDPWKYRRAVIIVEVVSTPALQLA